MTPDQYDWRQSTPVWREWWRRVQTKSQLPIMTVDQNRVPRTCLKNTLRHIQAAAPTCFA